MDKNIVSIPSNGSIQFLHWCEFPKEKDENHRSQSPQTGQFNSYRENLTDSDYAVLNSLNPLKRVNSILTGNVA